MRMSPQLKRFKPVMVAAPRERLDFGKWISALGIAPRALSFPRFLRKGWDTKEVSVYRTPENASVLSGYTSSGSATVHS